ncbi:MAG: phosphoribulokinase [Methanomicrobiales archaeon]|nr:phosphoribulokinase [Methanomicrobiales archaeon]MDI6875322.1 phosphoribulokinase [Methanomicrobiales archaeon]
MPRLKDIILRSPTIFTIGVAGDSGSGKTTFTNAIREIFGKDLVSTITLDDYHTLDREQRRERGVTPLAPEANDFRRLEEHLRDIKEGKTIQKPVYNHITGTIEPPVSFTPTKIVILEGLHAFFTPTLRELMDFKIFVDPDADVKRYWKIQRDMEVRGYRREEVVEELEARARDYERYVAPQCEYADALIKISFSKYGEDLGPIHNIYRVSICQSRLEEAIQDIDLTFDLFALLSLSENSFLLEFGREEMAGREMSVLTFDGELRYDVMEKLEESIEQHVQSPPRAIYKHRTYLTPTEIGQLLIAWRIINRRYFMEEREP